MRLGDGLTVLLGGARSGKSDTAVRLGKAWPGQVTFAATAESGDADMAGRINRHQADRPERWGLLEAPLLGAVDVMATPTDHLLIVDCVTLLVSNLLLADRPGGHRVDDHVAALAASLVDRPAPSIVVSNEVGMGVHPPTELGRVYRDALGRANRMLVAAADTALLMVAGRALPLEAIEWGRR